MDYEEFLSKQDEPGILRSRDYFNTLIKGEIEKGIKPSRIVLGGFSQGGAMSLFTGITGEQKLGGVFGLSCYLLLSDRIKKYIPENFPNKDTPFFMAHGKEDEVVKYNYGVMSKDALVDMGINVEFHDYEYVPFFPRCVHVSRIYTSDRDLGHSADPEEIEALERFLHKTLPAEGDGQTSAGL